MAGKSNRLTDKIVVLTTVGSEELATSIAESLVEQQLAACVNIQSAVRSIYRWKGKIWDDEEYLLVIKTIRTAFPSVRDAIKKMHSYELPEIIALPVADGDIASLEWIEGSVEPTPVADADPGAA